jgi:serine/threonine protein kinase
MSPHPRSRDTPGDPFAERAATYDPPLFVPVANGKVLHANLGHNPLAKQPVRIIGKLGEYDVFDVRHGGMGEVYLCLQPGTPVNDFEPFPIALKTLVPQLRHHQAARRAFVRECTVWSRLGSLPGVLTIFGIQEIAGLPFAQMPIVWPEPDGIVHLRDLYRWGKLPLDIVILISLEIVHTLEIASEIMPGVAHGDLKPENILLEHTYFPLISDFGIATSIEHSLGGDVLLGTPAYRAPELSPGSGALPSPATDIYSFGVILAEMILGALPGSDEGAGTPGPTDQAPSDDGRGVPAERERVRRLLLDLAATCRHTVAAERPQSFKVISAVLQEIARDVKWQVPEAAQVGLWMRKTPIATVFQWMHSSIQLQTLNYLGRSDVVERITTRWGEDGMNLDALAARGCALKRHGRDEDALKTFYRVLRHADDQPRLQWETLSEVALSLKHLERYEESARILRGLIDHPQTQTDATIGAINLAGIYIEAERFDAAEAVLDELFRSNADNPKVWAQVGVLNYRQGRLDQALEAFRKACQLHPHASRFQEQLADILLEANKPVEAAQAYERALQCGAQGEWFVQHAFACAVLLGGDAGQRLMHMLGPLLERYDLRELRPGVERIVRGLRQALPAVESEPDAPPPEPVAVRGHSVALDRLVEDLEYEAQQHFYALQADIDGSAKATLPELPEDINLEAALALVHKFLPWADEQEKRTLVEALHTEPVSLAQAAAFLGRPDRPTINGFCEALTRMSQELASDADDEFAYPERMPAAAYQLMLRHFGQVYPIAAQILEVTAFLAPYPIPAELLHQGVASATLSGNINDQSRNPFAKAVAQLQECCLLQPQSRNMFTVHPATQSILRRLLHRRSQDFCKNLHAAIFERFRRYERMDPISSKDFDWVPHALSVVEGLTNLPAGVRGTIGLGHTYATLIKALRQMGHRPDAVDKKAGGLLRWNRDADMQTAVYEWIAYRAASGQMHRREVALAVGELLAASPSDSTAESSHLLDSGFFLDVVERGLRSGESPPEVALEFATDVYQSGDSTRKRVPIWAGTYHLACGMAYSQRGELELAHTSFTLALQAFGYVENTLLATKLIVQVYKALVDNLLMTGNLAAAKEWSHELREVWQNRPHDFEDALSKARVRHITLKLESNTLIREIAASSFSGDLEDATTNLVGRYEETANEYLACGAHADFYDLGHDLASLYGVFDIEKGLSLLAGIMKECARSGAILPLRSIQATATKLFAVSDQLDSSLVEAGRHDAYSLAADHSAAYWHCETMAAIWMLARRLDSPTDAILHATWESYAMLGRSDRLAELVAGADDPRGRLLLLAHSERRIHEQQAAGQAQALEHLAAWLSIEGRPTQALAAVSQAVATLRTLVEQYPGRYDRRLAEVLDQQGVLLGSLKQLEEAVAVAREALELLRPSAPADDDLLAVILINLATHQQRMDHVADAIPTLRQALEIHRRRAASQPGEPDRAVADILQRLSDNLIRLGRQLEALPFQREAAEIWHRVPSSRWCKSRRA